MIINEPNRTKWTDWFGLVCKDLLRQFSVFLFRKMVFCIMSLASTFLMSCSTVDDYTFKSPDDVLHKYQNYALVLHDESTYDWTD